MKKYTDICDNCGQELTRSTLERPFIQEGLTYNLECANCACGATYSFGKVSLSTKEFSLTTPCAGDCDTCFEGCDKRQAPYDPSSFDSIEGLIYSNWKRKAV